MLIHESRRKISKLSNHYNLFKAYLTSIKKEISGFILKNRELKSYMVAKGTWGRISQGTLEGGLATNLMHDAIL